MSPPAQARPRLLATVFSGASLRRCIPIALLVGTVLSLVNQGSVIASGEAGPATAARGGELRRAVLRVERRILQLSAGHLAG